MRALRFAGVCVLVGALCLGAVGCARTSTPSVVQPVVAQKPPTSPRSRLATRTLDMSRSIPATTTQKGARTREDAAQECLDAVAKGDVAGYARVTGSTTSTIALADLRRELFGSSLTTETFQLELHESSSAVGKLAILSGVGFKNWEPFARRGLSSPPACPVLLLASSKTEHSWFILDAIPRAFAQEDEVLTPMYKPVILLYPPKPTHVRVRLDLDGRVTTSDPPYDQASHGWSVVAQPNGQLLDERSGSACSELFWEGETRLAPDFRTGFLVPRADAAPFLESKLAILGLNPAERAEFIAFWLPRMQARPYALVHFAGTDYERAARLAIEPEPDVVIRVHMEFAPTDEPTAILPQPLRPAPVRRGFTAVEWGGTQIEVP